MTICYMYIHILKRVKTFHRACHFLFFQSGENTNFHQFSSDPFFLTRTVVFIRNVVALNTIKPATCKCTFRRSQSLNIAACHSQPTTDRKVTHPFPQYGVDLPSRQSFTFNGGKSPIQLPPEVPVNTNAKNTDTASLPQLLRIFGYQTPLTKRLSDRWTPCWCRRKDRQCSWKPT